MARGLAARSSGDKFIDQNGEVWVLDNIEYFPSANTHYVDTDSLNKEISSYQKNNNIERINSLNTQKSNLKSAIIFSMSNNNSTNHYLRYFKKFNNAGLKFLWGGKSLKDTTGLSIHSNGAQSEHSMMKVSQIIPTEHPLEYEEVLEYISLSELPKDLKTGVIDLIHNFCAHADTYTPRMNEYRSVIEKYAGEFVAPLYCIKNNIIGNWNRVSFPLSANEPLVDSKLHYEDKTLGISSKSKQGAAASITTISNSYKNFVVSSDNPIRQKGQKIIDTMQIISDNNCIDGPLDAGVKLNIINQNDKDLITHYINMNSTDSIEISNNLKSVMSLIEPNMSHENYNVGFHMLSGVARKVCSELNNDIYTKDVILESLKSYNFVQAHLYTSKYNDGLKIRNVEFIDPCDFDGSVIFSANKPYMCTNKPKGRITFKMQKK